MFKIIKYEGGDKMKCPTCSAEIVTRKGKFGEFMCCPNGSHGTFSIQNGTMYYTGAVGLVMKNQRQQEYSPLAHISSGASFQPTLMQQINAQMAHFGWNATGEMEQLAEYAVGDVKYVQSDEDHWFNFRGF